MPRLRKLKYHEQKLVKKVDFLNWKADGTPEQREAQARVIAKFQLRDADEFFKYANIAKAVNDSLAELRNLKNSPHIELQKFRDEQVALLAKKLYTMGVIDRMEQLEEEFEKRGEETDAKSRRQPFRVSVSSFCKRRLSYIMKKKKYCESVKLATMYIVHGHVRIGPELITDPAFVVTKSMEDFITWTGGAIKTKIADFSGERDDYDLLNA